MKNVHLKIIVIATAFAIALAAALLFSGKEEKKEFSYTVLGDATLPVVTLSAEGTDVNTLYGYLKSVNEGEAGKLITPLPKTRELEISITPFGNAVTGISYEVRSIDGSDLIEQTSLESWNEENGVIRALLPIKDISAGDSERRLKIVLTTEKLSEISYYTTIVDGEDYKTAEMLAYVTDFHNSTFDAAAAQKYAVNWEPDGTRDADSLAVVDIHSNFNRLTYGELSPKQIGEAQIDIVELDETFGSFLLRFELQAENENGTNERYYVEEFFCVQWSASRFYLMSYERRMTQLFYASEETITRDGISFGIVPEEDVSIVSSENGDCVAFISGSEIWCYSSDREEIGQVFSFASSQQLLHRLHREYGEKIISVSNSGDIIFVVYGYMCRGEHEGENGLACYRFSREKNTLEEMAYLSTEHTFEIIKNDIDRLCVKKDNQIYLLFDDTVFSIDERNNETAKIIEGAAAHGFIANPAQSAFAWMQEIKDGVSSKLQIRYLDTGETQIVSVPSDKYVLTQGFIEGDFIYTVGSRSDIGRLGFGRIYPQSELIIADENGEKVGGYKKEAVYISRVTAEDGKITLERIKADGGAYTRIEDEILIQSDKEVVKEEKLLAAGIVERRGKIRRYVIKKATKYDECEVFSPNRISYAKEAVRSDTHDGRELFYGYEKGRLKGVFEKAGEAITAVGDGMGYVIGSDGNRIWHRKGIKTGTVMANILKEAIISDSISPLDMCVEMILKSEGVDPGKLSMEGKSPAEVLAEAKITALDLTGCTYKQAMAFLEKGALVIALDENDTPYLIAGYDTYNSLIYSFDKKDTYKMGRGDTEKMVENGGFRLFSYIRG